MFFNILLVIVVNVVSNYIYDRVPIKAVVGVSILITGTLGIIWGLWIGRIPMLLGINSIVAMMMWVLLTSIKKKVQMSFRSIISLIIGNNRQELEKNVRELDKFDEELSSAFRIVKLYRKLQE